MEAESASGSNPHGGRSPSPSQSPSITCNAYVYEGWLGADSSRPRRGAVPDPRVERPMWLQRPRRELSGWTSVVEGWKKSEA